MTRKFPWSYVPAYLVGQVIGAIAGAGATWATLGTEARDAKVALGATTPTAGVGDGRVFVVEALITFLLVFVIMAVATDARVPAAVAAPAIGFALVAAVLIGGAITGAVNPDRAIGPAVMSGTFTSLWVYILAELVGGIAAALLYDRVVARALAPTMDPGDRGERNRAPLR